MALMLSIIVYCYELFHELFHKHIVMILLMARTYLNSTEVENNVSCSAYIIIMSGFISFIVFFVSKFHVHMVLLIVEGKTYIWTHEFVIILI